MIVSLLALQLLLLWSVTACAPTAPTATRRIAPLTTMSVGLGEDYPFESWSIDIVRRDMDVMQRAGVKRLRVALAWDHIEPRPGEFDWHFWDAAMGEAQRRGIELLPYVCYTPRWNTATAAGYWRQPPRDVAAFARFMAAAAARYHGVVHSWELWNEPDNADYWTGSVEQYARLVRAGASAVRAADPSAAVVLGGISWNVSFLRQLFRDQHIGDSVDVINLHSYYETWIPDPLERLPEYVGRVRDLIARYGKNQAIWAAEIGYSDYRRGRSVSADNDARFDYEHTAAYQADDLFRALTLLRATDAVSLATWYRINDLPVTQDVIGDVNNRHLGIVTVAGEAKPAFEGLKEFQGLLGGPLRMMDRECRICRTAGSDVEAHCFQRADGDVIAVLWLRTEVAGSEQSSHDGTDARDEQVELMVPISFSQATQCDLLDPNWRHLPIEASNGKTTVSIDHLRGGRTRIVRLGGQ